MYLKLYSPEHSLSGEYKPSRKLHMRPYQVIGKDWLENNSRAMLTDWPGLGKTLQAGEAAKSHRPVLISCPTYLAQQWATFLSEQYPDDKVSLATGKTMHRFDRQARLKTRADWYIVNHSMMRIDEQTGKHLFKLPKVRTVIIDESHHFRNRTALQSIGAARYTANPNLRVYLLTATPVWKNTDDIWMQLHILQPEIFSSYNEFVDHFMIVDDSLYGPKVLGVKRQVKKELDALLSIVKFGRTYKQVGRYLPETIRSIIDVPFPPDLLKKYNEIRTTYRMQLENSPSGSEAFIL